MNPEFQLILLPGLGADHRLFEPQRKAFPELVVPPWIPPRKHETLPDYAARMAETVVPLLRDNLGTGPFFGEKARYTHGDCPNFRGEVGENGTVPFGRTPPLILGGVSFGGMMAYEMARHLKPDAVVQIASCRTRQGIGNSFRIFRVLLPLLPVQVWSVAKWLSSPVVKCYSRVRLPNRELLVTMFKEMDSGFMHWVLQAILNWDPKPLEGIRVFQIHGGRDPLISVRRVEADKIIPGGGHMINLTHAEEVNSFIRKAVESCNLAPIIA